MASNPLKWHGGKYYLASRIVALMPEHIHYVETHAGGLSVLLAKPFDGISEVVNDLDGALSNFWRVLACPSRFAEFHRQLLMTPFSENVFYNAEHTMNLDSVSGAVAFFVRVRQSLAGRMASFAPRSRSRTRQGMNEQVAAWLSAIEGLPEAHERLRRVIILNRDALDVIRIEDTKDTLFYVDPPYCHDTREATHVYNHEMTSDDHSRLLSRLSGIKGKFVLSGYHNALYDDYALYYNWHLTEFDIPNHASSASEKRIMTECVWTNYKVNNGR